jgi:hypothetical protein
MELMHSHDEGDIAIYTLRLQFIDPLGNKRSHFTTVSLPKSCNPQNRISFTAISSVDVKIGIVEAVSDLKIKVLLFNGTRLAIDNRHDFDFLVGDTVSILEHYDVMDNSQMLSDFALPYPLDIEPELLRLQSVNADLIDESGELVYRLSADPFYTRGYHDTRVEA